MTMEEFYVLNVKSYKVLETATLSRTSNVLYHEQVFCLMKTGRIIFKKTNMEKEVVQKDRKALSKIWNMTAPNWRLE